MKRKKNMANLSPPRGLGGRESDYHTSVLLHESIDSLAIQPDGIYVDATFGGGGHSKAILEKLGKQGRLIAFDQDEDALKNVPDDDRLTFVASNFRYMKKFLRLHEAEAVDGILADLGVSSWQFDTAERGFSYRFDGPLDMRMSKDARKDAKQVLNEYSAEALQKMFSEFGEVRNSKTLAKAIVEAREKHPLKTIADLKAITAQHRIGEEHKYLAQVFQAVRIEVNDELGALKEFLLQSTDVLKKGGRLAVITFHSLEDRLVKNFIRNGSFDDEPVKDMFGNFELKFKAVNKKPLTASDKEIKQNSRARSAKLRIAERI